MARFGRAFPVPRHVTSQRSPADYVIQGSLTASGAGTLSMTVLEIEFGTLAMNGAGTASMANAPWLTGTLALDGAGTAGLTPQRLKPVLLVSLASAAGTDSYGNGYPQGIGVFDNGMIVGSTIKTENTNGGLFVYAGAAT